MRHFARALPPVAVAAVLVLMSLAASAADLGNPPDVPKSAVTRASAGAAELAAVNKKLASITTLKAAFTQVDSRGTSHGEFYLARPGGLRFEYDPPRKLLVVANNDTVVVKETESTAPYRARVSETPLRLLINPKADLARDANIVDVHSQDGFLYVTAMETKGYGQGQVTFVFTKPGLDLRRWVVSDPMGAQTSVTLSDVKENVPLDKKELFRLPRVSTYGPHGNR